MPPWPSVLLEQGYRIAGIDHRILLPPASLIKPDVITLSRKSNRALLWECKSGGNVDVDQLDRYREFLDHASAKDIQRVTGIQFPDPDAADLQVAYCFLEEAIPRILRFFEAEPRVPVVSLGQTARSVVGDFHDAPLNQVFRPGFTIPRVEQVPWIIVADAETTDGEFALYLLPTVVSLIVKQSERVSVTDLLSQTFLDWQCISLDTRAALKEKAIRVLKEVCSAEFEGHTRFCKPGERLHEASVEVVSELMTQDPSTQTRGLQKLEEQVKDAAKRLEEGRPYVAPPPAAEQGSFPFEPSG
jgi:hypothetical protein